MTVAKIRSLLQRNDKQELFEYGLNDICTNAMYKFSVLRLLIGFLMLSAPAWNANAQAPGTFIETGSMTTPRFSHAATLLKDGRVLITGGSNTDIRYCLKS